MSGPRCKAAICCSGVAAKIQKIDELIVRGVITDVHLLAMIIDTGEKIEKRLDKLIDEIRQAP